MMDDIGPLTGCLLIVVLCGWAVWFVATQLRPNVESGTAVDRTLSKVDKDDAPGMFGLQMLGYVILIGGAALIGLGAMLTPLQHLFAR